MSASQKIFLFFLFFPQLNLGLSIFDSTPYALISGIVYIYSAKIKINKYLLITYFFLISYVILTNIILDQSLNLELTARQLLSISTVIIVLIALNNLDIFGVKFQKTLLIFSMIYFGGIVLQSLGFTLESVSHNRTGGGRGFTSFASEATYLGLFSLVLIIYFWELNQVYRVKNRLVKVGLLLSFLNLLLSSSSMALLFALIYILLRQVNFRVMLVFTCMGFMVFLLYLYTGTIASLRVFKLVNTFLNEPSIFKLMMLDASISERVSAIIFPYMGLWENNFLPGGNNTYETLSDKFRSEIEVFWRGSSSKIMNYFGTFVYELGIIIIIPGIIWLLRLMFVSVKNRNTKLFIFMIVIFNTGLPPMAGIFTFFLFLHVKLLTKGKI